MMQYLELKFGEAVMIGDNIRITLLKGRRGEQYNFGIDAPRDVPVHREEVYKKIQDEKNNTQPVVSIFQVHLCGFSGLPMQSSKNN